MLAEECLIRQAEYARTAIANKVDIYILAIVWIKNNFF
jgi:hypothetical protein